MGRMLASAAIDQSSRREIDHPKREDPSMQIPPAAELLRRIGELPAGAPLLDRLDDLPGVYLVGGAVRDLLMDGAPSELDLVVEGDAVQVARRLGENAVVHDRFGTSTVRIDGFTYDLARARRETYEHPGALPAVEPGDLAEDLGRRDFTVNAIAIALGGPLAGKVTAAPGATEDLAARRLRILHDKSFIDDPTRLFRLARYRSRLGFEIEPGTSELVREAVDSGALETVSGARIGAELRLLARERDPIAAFTTLGELRLGTPIHPGFGLSDRGLARRALGLLPADGRPDLLLLGIAARDVAAHELGPLLDRLAFRAGDRDVIMAVAVYADELGRGLAKAGRPSEIAAAVGAATPEVVALAGALGPERAAAEWLERLRHVRLEIDGRDLMDAGVPEGPRIGEGLSAALAAKLDGRAIGREQEFEAALGAAGRSGSDGG
jgi:tRNA nucleotidyltransferase (CCA-adding enzyme)